MGNGNVVQVPMSYQNNRYLLTTLLSGWRQYQCHVCITNELVKLWITSNSTLRSRKKFESTVLKQTLEAFSISKSRTTAYHPQGAGLVERFNRSLLQLLHSFVQSEPDWERYLPLVLYAYRTARHTSTSVSPFQLMFGRHPKVPETTGGAFDTHSYQSDLCAKLAEFQDLVTFYSRSQTTARFNNLLQETLFGYQFPMPVN